MNILLDTCTFLWVVLSPERLSMKATGLFNDPANIVYLSAVSAWEIGVKHGLGRIVLPEPPSRFVPAQRVGHEIDPLPLVEDTALRVESLPPLHRDPFDRMLICQALAHGLVILTPDPEIRRYPLARTEW